MIDLDAIEARANAATPGPWMQPTERERGPGCDDHACVVDHEGCAVWPWRRREDMEFAYAARTDVPALIARVRELEAERDAYARSHAILKAIHGALTDALPNTPIPALDSFDVVEIIRALANGVKP